MVLSEKTTKYFKRKRFFVPLDMNYTDVEQKGSDVVHQAVLFHHRVINHALITIMFRSPLYNSLFTQVSTRKCHFL